MAALLLVAAAVVHVALAYSNTSPLVAWSSSGSSSLQSLPSKLDTSTNSLSLIESILSGADICTHDAVILVAQPGLHSSDLRTLQPHSRLSQALASAPAARQYPYIPSYPALDVAEIGDQLAAKCNSRIVSYSAGTADKQLHPGEKHVVCVTMPYLTESGRERREAMKAYESLLSSEFADLASAFPNYLVIYTGSVPSYGNVKRQDALFPDRPILDITADIDYDNDYDFEDSSTDDFSTDELPTTTTTATTATTTTPNLTFSAPRNSTDELPTTTPGLTSSTPSNITKLPITPPKLAFAASAPSNATLPQGGILKRFQILTPALITGLLVSFFLLVPVLFLALSTLASIQIPIRSDVGKTFNAIERKNQ